ncbi:MAG TPA: AraC family transcriptional regulator [Limnochordia bacterium]
MLTEHRNRAAEKGVVGVRGHTDVDSRDGCPLDTWPEPIQMWHHVRSDGFEIFHRHAGIELHHCEEGTGYYQIADTRAAMRAGGVTLLQAALPHRVVAHRGRYCRTVVQFPVRLLATRCGSIGVPWEDALPTPRRPMLQLSLSTRLHVELDLLLKKVRRELTEGRRYAAAAISLHLTEVFLVLARAGSEPMLPANPLTPHEARLVAAVEEAVVGAASAPWSVSELAERLQVSAGHLRRVFRKGRGVSLHRFLLEHRLERGRKLLEEGARVTDAALECGYGDVSSFSRAFRAYTGTSPTEVRVGVRT